MITKNIDPIETDPRDSKKIITQEQNSKKRLVRYILGIVLLGLTLLIAIFGFPINSLI